MRMLDHVVAGLRRIGTVLRPHHRDFVCGQCERWERCSMPPNERCIPRLEQMERERNRPRRPTLLTYYSPYLPDAAIWGWGMNHYRSFGKR